MEDFIQVDQNGRFVAPTHTSKFSFDALSPSRASDAMRGAFDATHPTSVTPGSISATDQGGADVYALTLTAGVTYSFDYRSAAASGIVDPFLAIINGAFTTILASDDDGGNGIGSQITFTPTATGTYYLYATTWDAWFLGTNTDLGNYTLSSWSLNTAHDAPGTLASTATLSVGTNYANLDAAGDVDVYTFQVAAGQVYSFSYSGGVGAESDWGFPNTPGESIGYLEVVDAAGNVVSDAANYDTSLAFVTNTAGTYYLRVSGYEADMTGGYTIDHTVRPLTSYDPLESLNWDTAPNVPFADTNGDGIGDTAYVYFTEAGENLGFKQGEAANAALDLPSFGFNAVEQERILLALNNEYGFLLGINYVTTTNIEEATFKLILTEDEPYGARFLNYAPNYGANAGTGIFVRDNAGWSFGTQQSLLEGGYDYSLILHEFGHAHGIAHPHDEGGGSEIMLGVSGSQGSFGLFDLNQGVYTVMSYNDAWQLNPAGPSPLFGSTVDNGWSGGLGAFDIAILQQRYGLAVRNTGNDVYMLTDVVNDAFYETIWDSGGNDTIAYGGALNARIDLLAATLDYSPTGGGVISYLLNAPGTTNAASVRGGYTIANGVVIENATGGSGSDVLLGNSANNILTGNAGADTLMGREGADKLFGGAGVDTLFGGDGVDFHTGGADGDIFKGEINATKTSSKSGLISLDVITDLQRGSDKIDLAALDANSSLAGNQAFSFKGTNANKSAGDLTYKVYDSMNGAENSLGMEIDGVNSKNIAGPVTVVFGNVDGGQPDFAIVLLNTNGVSSGDFFL
jgi:hypothetical protein